MKLSDLGAGKIVVTDAGFTCLEAGEHVVQADSEGRLFIQCDEGGHYLDGQAGKDGELIGLSLPETHSILAHLTKKEMSILLTIFSFMADEENEIGAVADKLTKVMAVMIENLATQKECSA